jgi:hypothetical protein
VFSGRSAVLEFSMLKVLSVSRRKGVDQIFRHPDLSNDEKLIGFAVWGRINRETGCTFAHTITFARDVGVKHDVALTSFARLVQLGFFRSTENGNRTEIRPLPLVGRPGPTMRCGSLAFAKALWAWLENVMTDTSFTKATRIAAYGIAAAIDPVDGTTWSDLEHIAGSVGLSEKTLRRATVALEHAGKIGEVDVRSYRSFMLVADDTATSSGYRDDNIQGQSFADSRAISTREKGGRSSSRHHDDTICGQMGGQTDGQMGGQGLVDSRVIPMLESRNPFNPYNLYNTLTAPAAPGQRVFDWEKTGQRFKTPVAPIQESEVA